MSDVMCGGLTRCDGYSQEVYPLLRMPGANSSTTEWADCFPIERFPRLPDRKWKYYAEPFIGIAVVATASAVLIGLTTVAAGDLAGNIGQVANALVAIQCIWATTAAACVAFLLFGDTGVIERSPTTCYPVPVEAATHLARSDSIHMLRNVNGQQGTSYCVRCLVWRSGSAKDGMGHHCNTCQRCVAGFDHHCNVFGRCITNSNMPCFYLLMSMLFAGVLTAALAIFLVVGSQSRFKPVGVMPHDAHSSHPWQTGHDPATGLVSVN